MVRYPDDDDGVLAQHHRVDLGHLETRVDLAVREPRRDRLTERVLLQPGAVQYKCFVARSRSVRPRQRHCNGVRVVVVDHDTPLLLHDVLRAVYTARPDTFPKDRREFGATMPLAPILPRYLHVDLEPVGCASAQTRQQPGSEHRERERVVLRDAVVRDVHHEHDEAVVAGDLEGDAVARRRGEARAGFAEELHAVNGRQLWYAGGEVEAPSPPLKIVDVHGDQGPPAAGPVEGVLGDEVRQEQVVFVDEGERPVRMRHSLQLRVRYNAYI